MAFVQGSLIGRLDDRRIECGARCVHRLSINLFCMPDGKSAGVRCVHLAYSLRCLLFVVCCLLFAGARRPRMCLEFKPEAELCGGSRG